MRLSSVTLATTLGGIALAAPLGGSAAGGASGRHSAVKVMARGTGHGHQGTGFHVGTKRGLDARREADVRPGVRGVTGGPAGDVNGGEPKENDQALDNTKTGTGTPGKETGSETESCDAPPGASSGTVAETPSSNNETPSMSGADSATGDETTEIGGGETHKVIKDDTTIKTGVVVNNVNEKISVNEKASTEAAGKGTNTSNTQTPSDGTGKDTCEKEVGDGNTGMSGSGLGTQENLGDTAAVAPPAVEVAKVDLNTPGKASSGSGNVENSTNNSSASAGQTLSPKAVSDSSEGTKLQEDDTCQEPARSDESKMDDASSGGSAPNLRNNESGNTTKTESEETSNIKSNTETIASENINGISNTNSATTNSNGSQGANGTKEHAQEIPKEPVNSEDKPEPDTCDKPADPQDVNGNNKDPVAPAAEVSNEGPTAQNSNETKTVEREVDYEEDGNRPISFDVIKPNRPLKEPAPPVDHGTIQGGINSELRQE